MKTLRRPDFSSPRCGAVELGMMALSVGLSYLAGRILAKKVKNPIEDDKPTTLTTRGSYITSFVGIRNIGPLFAWAGINTREKKKESLHGGKGLSGPKQDVWYEAAWHQLAVGPCHALHQIVQSGKVIFEGPITSESHPSGSAIDLGKEGAFTIFWGEVDQPLNTYLGDAANVGITSRWPHCCYVVWNKKRLGSSPTWPVLTYVMERRPSTGLLTQSSSWYESTPTLDGTIAPVVGHLANADPNVGYIEVLGDMSQEFDPGRPVRLTGNSLPDGDYDVFRVETLNSGGDGKTRVFLSTGTLGSNSSGTMQAYTFFNDDGANIAHVIAEYLFADYPLGLQLNPNGVEPWDLDSLEELGVEAGSDQWRSSAAAVNGETAEAMLAGILQDVGVLLPIDTSTGKLKFQRIREPSGTLPFITTDLEAEELPEIEGLHGERPVDRMIFEFTDRDQSFGTMTIVIDEDGHASYLEHQRPRKVPIISTVHFATAAKLSEFRGNEELAGAGQFRLPANRAARELIPGQAIVSDISSEVLRVEAVEIDPLSETVNLKVFPDYYGARKSDFVNSEGGGKTDFEDPELDLQFAWAEIPEQLLSTEEMFVVIPRIRAHSQIVETFIHFSRDNTTYTLLGSTDGVATGGVLDVALDATSKNFLTQGPTFTLLGPDAGTAQDLSADPTNFGLGRQLAMIVSTGGIEICFVQKITAVSGSQYRLDGLMRARYDTRRVTHPIGAEVYVFSNTALQDWDDVLLEPEMDLYVKSQPATTAGSVPLSVVPPYVDTLYGKGIVPITPEGIYVSAPAKGSPSYVTGSAVTLRWRWSSASSPHTGAGFQSAGTPIGPPVIKGSFLVELLTPGNVLVQSDTVTVAEITYPNATLVAPPINEGNFKVRVTHVYNGHTSNSVEATVTKV